MMHRMSCAFTVAAGVLIWGHPAALRAQDMELPALLTQADSANPRIASAERTAEAAAARVSQAGAPPDPRLAIGLMNVPLADPGLGGGQMMTMSQVQLSGVLPWPGKLGLREAVARLSAEAADWEARQVRNEVMAEVKTAYYQVYFLDRALEVTGRNQVLLGDFTHLTSSRYGVGTAAQVDVLKAQVERTRLLDQTVGLNQQRVSAVARLNSLLGRRTDSPVPTVTLPESVRTMAVNGGSGGPRFVSSALEGEVPSSDAEGSGLPTTPDLQVVAHANNAMVQAHVRRVAAQTRALSLAERAKLPDLDVSAAYSYRSGRADFFNLMVSVPLPVFSGRKQDQGVLEQSAILAEHQARHHAMLNDLDTEIASLAAELRRAQDQLVLLDEGILPQARTGLASATASYRVDGVDFLTLLDAQVTLYRHELDYHRLLADFAENLAALERAVGAEVLP